MSILCSKCTSNDFQLNTPMRMSYEAVIPQKICSVCAARAETCYEFKVLCEHSDYILHTEFISKAANVRVEVNVEKKIVENEISSNIMEDTILSEIIVIEDSTSSAKDCFTETLPETGNAEIHQLGAANAAHNQQETTIDSTKTADTNYNQPETINTTTKTTHSDHNQSETTNASTKTANTDHNQPETTNASIETANTTHNQSETTNASTETANTTHNQSETTNASTETANTSHNQSESTNASTKTANTAHNQLESNASTKTTNTHYNQLTNTNDTIIEISENDTSDCITINSEIDDVLMCCLHCDFETRFPKEFNKHKKSIKKKGAKKTQLCAFCKATFPYNSPLYEKHLIDSHHEKNIGCKLCDKLFFTRKPLTQHMKQDHPGQKVPLDPCKMCGFRPYPRKLFRKNVRECRCSKNHREPVRMCDFCEFTSFSGMKLGAHMSAAHEDKKDIKCPMCNKKFFKLSHLSMHVIRFHQPNTPFVCMLCRKPFKLKTHLQQHMDAHIGVKKNECTLCGLRFSSLNLLVKHGHTHFDDEMKFECGECGVKLREKKTLKRHLHMHKRVKGFQCKFCPKKYSHSSALSIHKAVHLGLKNFKCEDCGKAFYQKRQLELHQELHS